MTARESLGVDRPRTQGLPRKEPDWGIPNWLVRLIKKVARRG